MSQVLLVIMSQVLLVTRAAYSSSIARCQMGSARALQADEGSRESDNEAEAARNQSFDGLDDTSDATSDHKVHVLLQTDHLNRVDNRPVTKTGGRGCWCKASSWCMTSVHLRRGSEAGWRR
jgi:hypothetical protein